MLKFLIKWIWHDSQHDYKKYGALYGGLVPNQVIVLLFIGFNITKLYYYYY